MKRIFVQAVTIALALILALGGMVACSTGGVKTKVVGKWYDAYGSCIDIKSDGTYKLTDSFGVTTKNKWKVLDDKKTIEFTGILETTYEAELDSDDNGEYLEFTTLGKYYKDKYPKKKSTSKVAETTTVITTQPPLPAVIDDEDQNDDTYENTDDDIPVIEEKTSIDPFDGLKLVVSGISPYCKVTVNNANCSDDAQMYVDYDIEDKNYRNGDSVTITAILDSEAKEDYTLSTRENEYKIENQPEYIDSLEGVDLTELYSELDDYVTARMSEAIGKGYFVGIGNVWNYNAINMSDESHEYFLTAKKNKINNDLPFYNSLRFIYSFSAKTRYAEPFISADFIVYNIIKYPDGTVKWGKDNPEAYDFYYNAAENTADYIITTTVMNFSDNYNIEKIEENADTGVENREEAESR